MTWEEVSKKLTSKSWYDRFYVEHLLEASRSDDHLARGLSFAVPSSVYLDWVRANPKARAADAVAWISIAEKDGSGRLQWHAELEAIVREFDGQADILSAIGKRLHPTSWWGGLAPHLEPIVPLVESWLNHQNAAVRTWAAKQLDWLRATIISETKRSDEDDVHF